MNESSPRFLVNHKTVVVVLTLLLPIVLCGGFVAWRFGRQAAAHERVENTRADILTRGLQVDDASMTEVLARTMSHAKTDRWTTVLNAVASDAFQ